MKATPEQTVHDRFCYWYSNGEMDSDGWSFRMPDCFCEMLFEARADERNAITERTKKLQRFESYDYGLEQDEAGTLIDLTAALNAIQGDTK